ncbi:hypothetical protein BGZ75_004476 [Mortierella antarctica]|nr:hypothetical protein BGZ75_004476 [Mortierella antarctica]
MATLGAADHQDPSSSSTPSSRSALSRRRADSVSSSSHDPSIHSHGSGSLMPSEQRPRSSSSSKALLTKALLEAQSAVQLDNAYDIPAALDAYRRAVNLLSKVMDTSSSADEQERLRTIHDSYLFRIHLLSSPPGAVSTEAALNHDGTPLSPTRSTLAPPPQSPPPQQPLPPTPKLPDQLHSAGPSSIASITPASSSNTIGSTQPKGHDSQPLIGAVPPPRRVRKHVPVPLQPTTSAGIPLPSEPRTPRQRADSTSASEHGSAGHTRHHTRSHTGGSTHRMTGDLVSAAEQLQIQAQQRIPGVPKVRSRDHLGVPIHSAPTVPLPPTPTTFGPLPSTPPPMPTPGSGSAPTSGPSTPAHSNPPTPNMAGNQTFMASLNAQPPTSPPPRVSLPQVPSNLTSPPASPANAIRKVSPLAASSTSQQQNQGGHASGSSSASFALQKSPLSPSEHSLQDSISNLVHDRFYEEELVIDEWLPDLSKGFSTTGPSLEHTLEDPYPRDRLSSKLSETLQEQSKTKGQQQQQQQQAYQHQRSASQSSTLSAHHAPAANQPSRSPLSGPMYSFQAGASSISSLHALDNGSHKRISDSSRSLKEGSPLARSAGGSGTMNGSTSASGSSSSLPGSPAQQQQQQQQQAPVRPAMLQHQSSYSKLSNSMTASSSTTSPTMDKAWSPSLNGHGHTSGGFTLFDVISDDPFAGMSFPVPPAYVEAPPTDPYLRCFWLMHRLEQSMTTGGFLTKRMYVPRAIWYQSLVRLPAIDAKVSACQTLTALFSKLATQSQKGLLNLMVEGGGGSEGDAERMTVLKELESLEQAANQVQAKLSKKLSFVHRPGKNGAPLTIATNQGFSEDSQGPVTGGNVSVYGGASVHNASFDWLGNEEPPMPQSSSSSTGAAIIQEKSSKKGGVSVGGSGPDAGTGGLKSQWKSFSKSVQKSIGNDKDTSSYTEAVVRLFQASYILENMLRHYNALAPFQTHIQIINRLRRLCDVLNLAICAFVVRDLGELMGKYVKRVGAWVAD